MFDFGVSNPSPNRRSGVDAGILQTEVLRGYDVSLASETPDDLIISPGLSSFDGAVAQIYFWNRTDDVEPNFILTSGSDFDVSPRFETYVGNITDPNGSVSSTLGSFYVSNNPPALWQNQDGVNTWKKISDDLGGENLEETLAIGNFSGSNDLEMSKIPGPTLAAKIRGEDTSDGTDGGTLILSGGTASGISGNGGDILISTGNSSVGNTGNLLAGSLSSTIADTGFASFGSGATTNGNSGNTSLFSGNANRDAGNITISSGSSSGTNAGDISITGGTGPLSGGSISILSGSPTSGNVTGAPVTIISGNGIGTGTGGAATLRAGNGGPGGGPGGSLFLIAGSGGGGADNGQILGTGMFSADNYQFGSGNPNSLGVSADEGSIFQRTTPGLGELWVNTNGSPLGWQKLAFAADFINSFSRLQYGSVSPALDNTGGVIDDFSDVLLYEGVRPHAVGTGTQSRAVDANGPIISFSTGAVADEAGWSIPANTSALRREHRFIAVFKFTNTAISSKQRISIGLSTADIATQLSADEPGGQYITLTKKDNANSWSFLTRGPGGPQSQGLSSITLSQNNIRYVVFDFTDVNTCRFQFLDESFDVLSERTATGVFIPSLTSNLYPVFGIRQTDIDPTSLKFYTANVITEADQILSGGAAFSNQTLQQVLLVGNETGGSNIIMTHGDFLLGETDGFPPNGGDITILSGSSTTINGSSGDVRLASNINTVVGSSGGSGNVIIQSGDLFDVANTGTSGSVIIFSGLTQGTGDTGNVTITTGTPNLGGASGDLRISTNFGTPSNCIPGQIEITGGSTIAAGQNGANIAIESGSADTPSGGNGGDITLTTGTGDPVANTNGGSLQLTTGNGINSGDGGPIRLITGAGGVTGSGGDLDLLTSVSNQGSGRVTLSTGDAETPGEIELTVGSSTTGSGSNLILNAGDGLPGGGGAKGGDIEFNPGLADSPGFLIFGGFVEKDAPAFKYGNIILDGLSTDANGDLSLTWGAGPLSSYSAFPFGTETTSTVSIFDPSFYADVRVTTISSVTLDLRFYDGNGNVLPFLAFGADSRLRFMTLVNN